MTAKSGTNFGRLAAWGPCRNSAWSVDGHSRPVRAAASPYVEGLRYIPPIAFVGLFVVWFGTGELSKILLVSYATFFIIVLNTMAGALSVPPGLKLAAKTLGASPQAVYFQVVLPSAIPHMATALRMALGNAFIVIAAAEMLSANSGMGFLIWTSRSLMLTDQIFVGFLVLGLMGIATDRLLRTDFGAAAAPTTESCERLL